MLVALSLFDVLLGDDEQCSRNSTRNISADL